MKLLDTSSHVPEEPRHAPTSLRPAEEVCRTRHITGRTTVRAAPRRVGAGSGPAATPRVRPAARPRPPPTHTRPPPCRRPDWARPNPTQPSWCPAWRGPENAPGMPEELTIAGRCRDHGPTRRCADLASCSEALDSGSIGRSRHDLVGWDSRGRNQQPTPPTRRPQHRSGTATGRSTRTRRGLRRGPGTIPTRGEIPPR